MGRGSREAALRDQCAELRPLQNLRHQGSRPEHQLGAARGWWWAELPEYVIVPLLFCGNPSSLRRRDFASLRAYAALRPCRGMAKGSLSRKAVFGRRFPGRRSKFANGDVVIHTLLLRHAAIAG